MEFIILCWVDLGAKGYELLCVGPRAIKVIQTAIAVVIAVIGIVLYIAVIIVVFQGHSAAASAAAGRIHAVMAVDCSTLT